MLKNLQEIVGGGVEHALHRFWSEQLSEAEAAAIHIRAQNEPGYREELDGSLEFLAGVEALADDREIRGIAQDYRQILQEHRSRRRLALGMAAGMLVAVGAALTYFSPWNGPDDSNLQEYFTRIGEQQTVELNDGSVVTLNTGGQLVVDYSEEVRRILLERGEAFFEVAKEAERPFTVDLGARSVTAVGTAFNIRKLPEHYQVAVFEGAVSFHKVTDEVSSLSPLVSIDGQPVVISAPVQHSVEAGWVAEFDVSRGELSAFRPESIDRYQDWRNGMLSFTREPLYQVIQELNRYSQTKILIEDTLIMELNVYTTVNVQDIDSALKGLELVLPIKVTKHYDRIVISASAGN